MHGSENTKPSLELWQRLKVRARDQHCGVLVRGDDHEMQGPAARVPMVEKVMTVVAVGRW